MKTPAITPTTKESDIEAYLVASVQGLGGHVRKARWLGRRGAPDRRVMIPENGLRYGCALWVELKAPGKKPTKMQAGEHELMRRCGERVWVIDTFELVDDLVSWLADGITPEQPT